MFVIIIITIEIIVSCETPTYYISFGYQLCYASLF
jgi:hypothetical protein